MTKAKAGGEQPVEIPDQLPILPLRNSVLFPGSIIPIDVGCAARILKVIKLAKDNFSVTSTWPMPTLCTRTRRSI